MDGWLKQNTAVTIKYGPFVSSTDGFTPCPSTGDVALATSEVRLTKNGGDFAAKASATTSVYDEYGYFNVSLSTGDVGTLGLLMVAGVTTAAYFAVPQTYMVLPANVYDSFVAGSDVLDISVVQLKGGTSSADDLVTLIGKAPSKSYLTGSSNADGDIDAAEVVGRIAADMTAISGGTSAADYLETYTNGTTYMPVNAIQVNSVTPVDAAAMADAVWDEAFSGHTSSGSAGDAIGRLDEISTGIATVEAKLPSASYLAGSTSADGSVLATISTASVDTVVAGTWGALLSSYASTGTMGDAVNRLNEMSTGIASIEAKLPSKAYLTGTTNADGDFDAGQVVGDYTGAVGAVTAGTTLTTGAADAVVAGTWGALLTSYASTGTMGDAVNRLNEMSTGITTIEAKLPSKAYLTGTTNSDGSITADTISGDFAGSVGSVAGAVGSVTAGTTLSTGAEDSLWTWEYESTESVKDYLRISRGALYGVSAGGGTATAVFYGRTTDVARITATVSTAGNRTAVTVDASTL